MQTRQTTSLQNESHIDLAATAWRNETKREGIETSTIWRVYPGKSGPKPLMWRSKAAREGDHQYNYGHQTAPSTRRSRLLSGEEASFNLFLVADSIDQAIVRF